MAEGKKSFIVYTSWYNFLEELNNEQLGQTFRWIMEYCNDKNPEYPSDIAVKMAIKMIQPILKQDLKKYEIKVDSINRAREKRKINTEINNDINIDNNTEINTDINQCNMLNVKCNMLNDNVNNNNVIYKENVIKEKSTTSRFIPPTLQEIKDYCHSRNNLVDPDRFFNFYESKGWMVGKNKMKDWKAAIRTWEKECGFKSTSDDDNAGFEVL